MPIQDQSLLQAALLGLEAQMERLDAQIQEVRGLLGKRGPGRPPKDVTAAPAGRKPASGSRKKGRRKMSAEGRARIAEAQRRRWAAARKG